MEHQASQLPPQPPTDDLQALLAPLQVLSDPEMDALSQEAEQTEAGHEDLLQFHLDGTPVWWPLNRGDPNGKNWSLTERRTVLLRRIRETQPGVSPQTGATPAGRQQLVRTLRQIASALRAQTVEILNA